MRGRFLARRPWLLLGALWALGGCGAGMFLHVTRVDLGDRLKLYLGGGGNSAVWLQGREALVVDVKMADFARRLKRAVETDLGRRVRRVVLTHVHGDHSGGLGVFPDVGAVLVHPRTRERLQAADRDGKLRAVPFVDVENEVRLVLGGREVRVLHFGPAHTDGDLVVYFPEEKVLVAGDLLLDGYEPYADTANGGDLLGFRRALDSLMKLDFEKAVPGHGEVVDRARAGRSRDYLAALEAAVRAQVAKGKTEDQAVAEVTLPEFPLKPLPLASSREKNVRAMYRSLEEAVRKAAP